MKKKNNYYHGKPKPMPKCYPPRTYILHSIYINDGDKIDVGEITINGRIIKNIKNAYFSIESGYEHADVYLGWMEDITHTEEYKNKKAEYDIKYTEYLNELDIYNKAKKEYNKKQEEQTLKRLINKVGKSKVKAMLKE